MNWAKVGELLEKGASVRKEKDRLEAEKADRRREAAIARRQTCVPITSANMCTNDVGKHVYQYLNNPLKESVNNLSATAFDERVDASLSENEEAEATRPPSGDTTTSEGQNERKVRNKKKVVSLQPKLNAKREVDTLVCNFYSTIGQPNIPKGLLKRGHKHIVQLLEDYTLDDVTVAIDYVRDGQKDEQGRLLDERGKPIGAIGYLSHIIARAVEEKKAKAEAEDRQRARERQARIEDDERARKAREELLANMPPWLSPSMRDKVLKGY
jgi:hypothetical protein